MSSFCIFYLQDDYHDGFAGPFSWETKVKLALLFTLKVTVFKKTYHINVFLFVFTENFTLSMMRLNTIELNLTKV